ncbi:MAG: peptidoglycan DD-metalloendopeptidase family protein [Bacillota bacterium]
MEDKNKDRKQESFWQERKQWLKEKLTNMKSGFKKPASKRKMVILFFAFFIMVGAVLSLYENYLNRQQEFEFDVDQNNVESFPLEITEQFGETDSGIDEEYLLDEIGGTPVDVPQENDTAEKKDKPQDQKKDSAAKRKKIDSGPQKVNSAENEVTEPLKPVMDSEQEEIQLLKPVEGEIVQESGWYYHPVFKDWRYLPGINISAKEGQTVMAADSGEVIQVTNDPYKGVMVELNHEDVWETSYGHLSEASVSSGEKIAKGQKLGSVGQSGMIEQPLLYFELRGEKGSVDPRDSFE